MTDDELRKWALQNGWTVERIEVDGQQVWRWTKAGSAEYATVEVDVPGDHAGPPPLADDLREVIHAHIDNVVNRGAALDEMFPVDASVAESQAGFYETKIPHPSGFYLASEVRALMLDLPGDLHALKVRDPSGAVSYTVRKQDGTPVANESQLDVILARFKAH